MKTVDEIIDAIEDPKWKSAMQSAKEFCIEKYGVAEPLSVLVWAREFFINADDGWMLT